MDASDFLNGRPLLEWTQHHQYFVREHEFGLLLYSVMGRHFLTICDEPKLLILFYDLLH